MKKLIIPVILSLAAVTAILAFTANEQTLPTIANLDLLYVFLLAALWVLVFSSDAVSMWFLVRASGESAGFLVAYKVAAIRIFFNLLTPFGFGGQPSTVVVLNHSGVAPGKGTVIAVTRLLMFSVITQFVAFGALLAYHRRFESVAALKIIFLTAGVIGLAFISLIISGVVYPRLFIYIINGFGKLLSKVKLVDYGYRFKRIVVREAFIAKKSFGRYFTHHKGYFAGSLVFSILMYFFQLLILFVIFRAFRLDVTLKDGLILSSILLFAMLFLPTPGASGLGEVAFAVIMGSVVPSYLLGVGVVIWRIFFQYITAFIGGVLVFRSFSIRMFSGKGKSLDEVEGR